MQLLSVNANLDGSGVDSVADDEVAAIPVAELELPGVSRCLHFASDGFALVVACDASSSPRSSPSSRTLLDVFGASVGRGSPFLALLRVPDLSPVRCSNLPVTGGGAFSPFRAHGTTTATSTALRSATPTCIDWAPDPCRPGLAAIGDTTGTVHLVGLHDVEEWARHMSVAHHAGLGLRQVVHGTLEGVRSKTRGIASGAKEGISQAITEAKFIAKDLKESPVVQGLLGLFRRD